MAHKAIPLLVLALLCTGSQAGRQLLAETTTDTADAAEKTEAAKANTWWPNRGGGSYAGASAYSSGGGWNPYGGSYAGANAYSGSGGWGGSYAGASATAGGGGWGGSYAGASASSRSGGWGGWGGSSANAVARSGGWGGGWLH
ncbi:MAG: hypothetical protein J3K34DRAFT_519465 [Monoraphidium minutum]|nr:MAG: hypothetical protein J3K34DRAFT_519465 [Monoraphidium minutum]